MKAPILGIQMIKSETKRSFESGTGEVLSGDRMGESIRKRKRKGADEEVPNKPLYTGRYLVVFNSQARSMSISRRVFEAKLGFKVASSSDFTTQQVSEEAIKNADAYIIDELGIALIDGEEGQRAQVANDDEVLIVEPEKVCYVPEEFGNDSVAATTGTWGLQSTNVLNSRYSGRGVKVAILDTGMDLTHPDFSSRNIVHKTFVPNEAVQDLHGHGTHCIGTACGHSDPQGLRYGVAYDAQIYAGKVLNNMGSGAQTWIINGMAWAANNRCKVISMSICSRVHAGSGIDLAYERAGQYALSNGSIVVAAAGNDSRRNLGVLNPVSSSANCPSVLAVGAVDSGMGMANFSNRAINPGQVIDIVGPGVQVYSSWPVPLRYNTISGTSMATPHVAGILALLWEQYPTWSPTQIIQQMRNLARNLGLPLIDMGSGLVVSP